MAFPIVVPQPENDISLFNVEAQMRESVQVYVTWSIKDKKCVGDKWGCNK